MVDPVQVAPMDSYNQALVPSLANGVVLDTLMLRAHQELLGP
jgi:hypothetical protein